MSPLRRLLRIGHWSFVIGHSAALCAAATYHIDHAEGDNAADGLTPATAWKHAPGDSAATGAPAAVALVAGDTVLFKGGVTYRGSLLINASGAEGSPVTYDGNTAGDYGTGRAILDGGQVIADWRKVASADDVKDNPRWREIFYTDIDVDVTSNTRHDKVVAHRFVRFEDAAPWQRVMLADGDRKVLPIARLPKPEDEFFPDLPGDFYKTPIPLRNTYPHKIYYPPGSKGNDSLPLLAITYGGAAPVIQPFDGGEVAVDLDQPALIAEIGLKLYRPKTEEAPESVAFYADGKEVHVAALDPRQPDLQRFTLPAPVEARTITFRLRAPKTEKTWGKFQQFAAYTPDGVNILRHDAMTVLRDPARLTAPDPKAFEGVMVGFHGGNNQTFFADIKGFDPARHQIAFPLFQESAYRETRYAFYNSPAFIELPGEWTITPLGNGKSRIHHLPFRLENGLPANVAYPVHHTAITLAGKNRSHLRVQGFLIQRYSGGQGGISALRSNPPARDVVIANNEIRFVSGEVGIGIGDTEDLVIEHNTIRHCPGWTAGIFMGQITRFRISDNRLDKNSGSGIRLYEGVEGVVARNVVLDHYGIHSSGMNFYQGCTDLIVEGNFVENIITMNRNAERLVFRNNVVDAQNRAAIALAIWQSGWTRGNEVKDIRVVNNTFVNTDQSVNWGGGLFAGPHAKPPEGLVVRDNVMDFPRGKMSGVFEDNIYFREPEDARFMGAGNVIEPDLKKLFIDPENRDFRRRPDGPRPEAGATLPPPSAAN